ncbi:alpha/beta hydrolase family protein DUF900 [Alteromonadaceae bacterium 2753L.S.0a.02]|nr:alpha/beta hydrolase family protein DUF900 [Alteromonadaceae bacterium 2753L.S.0a.02]
MNRSNFVICVRNTEKKANGDPRFGNEPGATRYLEVPDGQTPHPEIHKKSRTEWLTNLMQCASLGTHDENSKSAVAGFTYGDILVFVHGYNNSMDDVMQRHNLLQDRLAEQGYQGAIVSFDWPSASAALNYLEDRADAKTTAHKLVKDGIEILAKNQLQQDKNKCDIDVHILGHSTGAYVVREAFYEASQRRSLARINWQVSQVVFIGGDIARQSLSHSDSKSQALFRHATRITNYQNPFDSALKVSNVKRLGIAPRIGRVGIPDDAPDNIVNVHVGKHWRQLNEANSRCGGNWSHSWYFDDARFSEDLYHTLCGDIDRNAIPSRSFQAGELELVAKPN